MNRKKIKKDLYAVILAGGSGTRFWPVSRKAKPKQFLDIMGRETLFKRTIMRALTMVGPGNIFVVAGAHQAPIVRKQIVRFKIPNVNLLLEPEGKNTAPSICWAASLIQKKDKGAIILVLPSDHLITNGKAFKQVVGKAVSLAKKDYLVTVGIVPTRPETGYGYLKTVKQRNRDKNVLKVKRFIEKPPLAKAKIFMKRKNYLWNAGIFVWKTSVILDEFKMRLPTLYKTFKDRSGRSQSKRIWRTLPKISVDYGIMEKAAKIAAVPAKNIGWSDLGSWETLFKVQKKDKNGNVLKGNIISIDSKDTLVFGRNRLIATIGLKNTVVIDTPDALLVCRKDLSQKVKDIVELLEKKKRSEY